MRLTNFVKAVIFLPALTFADDSSDFADRLMAARYSVDDAPYRALFHSSMKECKNFLLNKKSGDRPSEYEYSITEVSERTIRKSQAGARMAGLGSLSYTVEPTHEISLSWEGVNEFSEGHPCHSETTSIFSAEVIRENQRWRITSLCISTEGYDVLQGRIARGRELRVEREASVNTIYAQLDLDQRAVFNSKLHEHKVHAINHYSQALYIDLTTAKGLWHKMCSEY